MKSTLHLDEQVSPKSNKESENILEQHIQSFCNNDLETLMSDYTEQSVMVTYDKTYTGPQEIRSFFQELMTYFPKDQSTFNLDKLVVNDELGFIVWNALTPSLEVSLGTDTFLIKNGKIYKQTFAGKMNFLN